MGCVTQRQSRSNLIHRQQDQAAIQSQPLSPIKNVNKNKTINVNQKLITKLTLNNYYFVENTQIAGIYRDQWVPLKDNRYYYKGQWFQDPQKKIPHGKGIVYDSKQEKVGLCYFKFEVLQIQDVKIVYSDESFYEGCVNLEYVPNGQGKLINNTAKETYEGEFLNGQFNGEGILTSKNQKFIGKFEKNKKVQGTLEQFGKGTYQGPFINNQKHGKGIYEWHGGGKYWGYFQNNLRHGKGKLYDADGQLVFNGQWMCDNMKAKMK